MSLTALPLADQVRLQRIAEHVAGLGPRVVAEALAEALAHGDMDRLEAYRRLSAGIVDFVIENDFPPSAVTVPVDLFVGADEPQTQHEGGTDREVA